MTDPTVKLLADRLARRAIFDKSGGTISATFAQDPLADLIEQALNIYREEAAQARRAVSDELAPIIEAARVASTIPFFPSAEHDRAMREYGALVANPGRLYRLLDGVTK